MVMTPTFESVLWDKYNIRERFSALGTFVAYPNFSGEASGLVVLGISTRCLVVANVILCGDAVDYELVSLSPLHLLSLHIQNYHQKKIVVDSPYKLNSWIYQLCSCENQEEIWKSFVCSIKKSLCQTYCCPGLDAVNGDSKKCRVATIIPSNTVILEAPCYGQDMNNNAVPMYQLATNDFVMKDDVGMDESIPIEPSIDSLYEDVEFDSFVNDNDASIMADMNMSNNAGGSLLDATKDSNVLKRFKLKFKNFFK